ncbi:TetR/AcrR family transcriptional regulator [Williamsia maris]|uniref:Transcriptional regulator, TetR family n=1 Tax=Williamsia maris TaxID=72806 RepID=A0ABT1HG05_9NOCA|nr:TetR/AcrR family transcriptional regulator [Williamsia maris]MCP2177109.1 transcriptional regulator, TetR family [Williamsia maris]
MTTAPVRDRESYHHGNLREVLIEGGLSATRLGGPAALSIRDATRRAGVSPNAAYRHFRSRDDLLVAVIDRIQTLMATEMETTPDDVDAVDALRAVGLGYIRFALAEPGWFGVAFTTVGSGDATPLPAPLARLVAALDGLVSAGVLSADDRAGAEWPCWSAVHGFTFLALHGPLRHSTTEDLLTAARRTVDIAIDGLLFAHRSTDTTGEPQHA